jgi:exodeoxyribonuclease VII small subunit
VNNPAAGQPTFDEALAELEGIVRTLEDGATGLDDALAAYERGVGLLKSCYQHLRQAEQRVLKLTGTDADGRPALELFEHTAAVEADRPDPKRRPPLPKRGLLDE